MKDNECRISTDDMTFEERANLNILSHKASIRLGRKVTLSKFVASILRDYLEGQEIHRQV